MNSNKKILLKAINAHDDNDISSLYFLMNDPLSMDIRNQKREYASTELKEYLHNVPVHGDNFILVQFGGQSIGYFQVSLNMQHRIAHVYFSFLWNKTQLENIFSSAFQYLSKNLYQSHHIERIVLPISGEHPNVQKLLLACPDIQQSITLAQENLDRNNQRQSVTFYDSFLK